MIVKILIGFAIWAVLVLAILASLSHATGVDDPCARSYEECEDTP